MKNSDRVPDQDADVSFRDVAPALETICWVIVVLTPLFRWANGPPVTSDQAVVQITLVALALAGAIGLRIYRYRQAKRANDLRPTEAGGRASSSDIESAREEET